MMVMEQNMHWAWAAMIKKALVEFLWEKVIQEAIFLESCKAQIFNC